MLIEKLPTKITKKKKAQRKNFAFFVRGEKRDVTTSAADVEVNVTQMCRSVKNACYRLLQGNKHLSVHGFSVIFIDTQAIGGLFLRAPIPVASPYLAFEQFKRQVCT